MGANSENNYNFLSTLGLIPWISGMSFSLFLDGIGKICIKRREFHWYLL